MKTNKNFSQMKKLATELDNELIRKINNLVGVAVIIDRKKTIEYSLCVKLSDHRAKKKIPPTWKGAKVGVEVVGTPQFASAG